MKVNIEIALFCYSSVRPIGEAVKYKKLFKYASKYELIDRLYRRYVRHEDIAPTKELVEQIFDELSFDEHLRKIFLDAYDKCVDDVRKYKELCGKWYKDGDKSPPIRIVNVTSTAADDTSAIPDYMWYISAEGEIPLEDYDNLEGNPFWMRPEYVVEKYL